MTSPSISDLQHRLDKLGHADSLDEELVEMRWLLRGIVEHLEAREAER